MKFLSASVIGFIIIAPILYMGMAFESSINPSDIIAELAILLVIIVVLNIMLSLIVTAYNKRFKR